MLVLVRRARATTGVRCHDHPMLRALLVLLCHERLAVSLAACPELVQQYCHTPTLMGTCTMAGPTWVGLRSCAGGKPGCPDAEKEWRCYAPTSLNANHTAYESGNGYCSRNAQILELLKTCKLPQPPPPPAPRVQSNATEVFVPGEGGAYRHHLRRHPSELLCNQCASE